MDDAGKKPGRGAYLCRYRECWEKGLKEKLLAALRGGITTVLIPEENRKDLAEIPDNVKQGMEIIPVAHVDEVLARTLTEPLEAIEWTEADELASYAAAPSLQAAVPSTTAH